MSVGRGWGSMLRRGDAIFRKRHFVGTTLLNAQLHTSWPLVWGSGVPFGGRGPESSTACGSSLSGTSPPSSGCSAAAPLHEGKLRGWFRRSVRAAELLAEVAQELDVAVLVLGRAPAAEDCAGWEQHADRMMVLSLTNPANEVQIAVQWNRFGPTGRVTPPFAPGPLHPDASLKQFAGFPSYLSRSVGANWC